MTVCLSGPLLGHHWANMGEQSPQQAAVPLLSPPLPVVRPGELGARLGHSTL